MTTILTDDGLRGEWQAELDEVRGGMVALRKQECDAEVGKRRAYYPVQEGPREDAILMSLPPEAVWR